jgi:hypothetical protein
VTTIVMYRGDDKTFPFTLTQGELPVDLTGASIAFTARTEIDATTASLSLTSVGGDITILPNQTTTDKGKITVTIPAADSVDLDPGTYLADIQVTEADGDIWTWPEPDDDQSTLIRLKIRGDVNIP